MRLSFVLSRRAIAMVLLALLLLTACVSVNLTAPTQTPLPTETAIATETIVWFPATPTPTVPAVATRTEAPAMNPGIGAVTLTDTFRDETLWDTAVSEDGSAAISNNRLSIAVQPGIYLTSMRHDLTLSDFYAEITARPSLCRGDDSYGILARTNGPSFYRFTLTCNGQIYAERISGGVKLQIQEPVLSGDAPRPPAEVRVGIWAVGGEMRLFLNDRYQFTVVEKNFPSGGFGVFVRSAGNELVSVTFSDFKVYNVDYVLPTSTPILQP